MLSQTASLFTAAWNMELWLLNKHLYLYEGKSLCCSCKFSALVFFIETHLPCRVLCQTTVLHVMIYDHDFFSRWMLDCCRISPTAALATTQTVGAGTNPLLQCVCVCSRVFFPHIPKSSSFYLVDNERGLLFMYQLFIRMVVSREISIIYD